MTPTDTLKARIERLRELETRVKELEANTFEKRNGLVEGDAIGNFSKMLSLKFGEEFAQFKDAAIKAYDKFKQLNKELEASNIDLQRKLEVALDGLTWIKNHPYAEARLLVEKAEQALTATDTTQKAGG